MGSKRLLQKSVNSDSLIESDGEDPSFHLNSITTSEVKRSQEHLEAVEAERKGKIEHLSKFVKAVNKYSAFLSSKLSTAQPSSSSSDDDSSKASSVSSIREDILSRLKYFKGELRPYQMEGVTWLTVLFENSINGILGDEMGLGKTIQIIALICHLYERMVSGPFLIVVPLSTLVNWQNEFAKFASDIPVVSFYGNEAQRVEQKRLITKNHLFHGKKVKPVVITSYQMPILEGHFFESITWQYVIVDEGHRLKNPLSKLSLQLRNLKSVNRTLLTGTPLQNNTEELWALLHFLMPTLFKNLSWFSALLELDHVKDKTKLLETEAKNHLISTIQKTLAPFMLRREKKFVLRDLVPKGECLIFCRLSELQTYLYRATLHLDMDKLSMKNLEPIEQKRKRRRLSRFYIDEDEQQEANRFGKVSRLVPSNKHVPVNCPDTAYMLDVKLQNVMMMLRKIVNHPYLIWTPLDKASPSGKYNMHISEELIQHSGKLQVLDAMLPKLKAMRHKVLIFSTLVVFLDIVEEMLLMRGYKFCRLDGGRNLTDREENIREFNNDKNVFIFLLSTRAGGLGLNLVAADTVIFLDRDWNPMVDIQAQDRCHRIGQDKPVMVYSLVCKGTVDEIVLNRGDIKKRLEKIIIQEGKFSNLKISASSDDLLELEDILSQEEECQQVKSNGILYSEEELLKILNRDELKKKMKN